MDDALTQLCLRASCEADFAGYHPSIGSTIVHLIVASCVEGMDLVSIPMSNIRIFNDIEQDIHDKFCHNVIEMAKPYLDKYIKPNITN